jgi:hypothetical protein
VKPRRPPNVSSTPRADWRQQADLGLRLGAVDSLEQVGAQIIATRAELDVLQSRAQLQASRNALEDALRAPLVGAGAEIIDIDFHSRLRSGT